MILCTPSHPLSHSFFKKKYPLYNLDLVVEEAT